MALTGVFGLGSASNSPGCLLIFAFVNKGHNFQLGENAPDATHAAEARLPLWFHPGMIIVYHLLVFAILCLFSALSH